MVRRRALIALAAVLALPSPAAAASRKVALGDYRWSAPRVAVDLGETVTWIWAGPDTRHSVSPSDAAAGLPDSEAGGAVRARRVGDRFAVRFTRPGTYGFACRLHGAVAGTVTVGEAPAADPDAPSPDPEPVLRPDRTAPRLDGPRVARGRLTFALDERARIAVDLVRVVRGQAVLVHTTTLRGHVGRNAVRLRGALRPRRAGAYRLVLRPVDAAGNRGRERAAAFRVR